MKTTLQWLLFSLPLIIMLVLWSWMTKKKEATYFTIPHGIVAIFKPNEPDFVYYTLVIGKEQVIPSGTVWKNYWSNELKMVVSAEPQWDGPTLQKAMKQQNIQIK